LDQEIESIHLTTGDRTYIHVQAERDANDRSALGMVIQEKGLWQQEDSTDRTYFLLYDATKPNPMNDETTVCLSFDDKMHLSSAKVDKRYVCIDKDQKHERSLAMVGSKEPPFYLNAKKWQDR
jgi:hypothetical protein